MDVRPSERLGGEPELRLLLHAAEDVAGALGDRAATSATVDRASAGTAVRIREMPALRWAQLAEELESSGLLADFRPHVVALSLAPELPAPGVLDDGRHLVRMLKDVPTHVVVFNGSTFVPGESTASYARTEEPTGLRIARLDLALLELSADEGISVVDADRLLAELGADRHVRGAFRYDVVARGALRDELVRVVADYGFFELRPLIEQLGGVRR